MTSILAIDRGTSKTKVVLFDCELDVLARASRPLVSHYPADGWAEQSAGDIWHSVRDAIAELLERSGAGGIDALAIANQRETLVVWDAGSGRPVAPAILWQCRRTAAACAELKADGHGASVEASTGLGINPLFPASKLGWVMENVDGARDLAASGRLQAGTVDAWLVWNLTGGAVFATDHSNASRTQLFDSAALAFSDDLCRLCGVPISALPEPRDSDASFSSTAAGATALPAGTPIRGVMGDSHAALHGHGVQEPGVAKATFGTGSSLMALTPSRIASTHGLSGTIAWTAAGHTAHAIEGKITVSVQAAAFMARMLGLADAAALSDLARTLPDAGGVSFVPALAGLGSPPWDDAARGTIAGMTLATTPGHLARATFEAIALQVANVFDAMENDTGQQLDSLRADGGASGNDWLMQLQADLLGRRVNRNDIVEIRARGAAAKALAALDRPVPNTGASGLTFKPRLNNIDRLRARTTWRHADDKARDRAALKLPAPLVPDAR